MEIPGVKKYSNDNIFLNTLNDLSRDAYKTDTKANNLDKKPINRFETDIVLNSKESFDNNNQRLNSMQEEIISLKNKLKSVYEKDEEIQKLKNEKEKIVKEIELKDKKIMESDKLIFDNKVLRDQNDKLQIESMNYNSLKQENQLLKTKITELDKKEDGDRIDKEINNIEEIEEIPVTMIEKEKIKVDALKLKDILNNRLKSYHEKHIEKLLLENDLYEKDYIDKELLEKILLDAIHL